MNELKVEELGNVNVQEKQMYGHLFVYEYNLIYIHF